MSIRDTKFVIYNPINNLFWNDEDGWGHMDTASKYDYDMRINNYPPLGGFWLPENFWAFEYWKDLDE